MRLLILAVLAYLIYHVVKNVFKPRREVDRGMEGGVIDEMVQDPMCKTYIPRRESVKRNIAGQDFFFCGNECASRFESERGNDP